MIEIEFLFMKIYIEYRTERDMHPITLTIIISLIYLVLAEYGSHKPPKVCHGSLPYGPWGKQNVPFHHFRDLTSGIFPMFLHGIFECSYFISFFLKH